jgi:predicted DNA-binding ribbon-helix-helix protein
MTDTTTVRINRQIYNELKIIADSENETLQKVIEKAVEEYKARRFFQNLNEAVSAYKVNEEDWEEEKEERKLWDNTLNDSPEGSSDETW